MLSMRAVASAPGRPVSESGRLCYGDSAHRRGGRRRMLLMSPSLLVSRKEDVSRAHRCGQSKRILCIIARQRPGTAKGFVFLSLEDETGISNVIVNPDLYEKYRVVINREKFLRVEGVLQNQDHTISIKASRVLPISITAAETQSHDFH